MTTKEKQEHYLKNNLYNNISSINFSECEKILQEKYQIEEPLIIIKVDIKRNNTFSTQVEYEVFDPTNLQKLNLSYCDNSKIDLYPPLNIDNQTLNLAKYLKDQGYNLFNSKDTFYHDVCSPFNSFNETDVILNDRKNDYYIPNISLCEDNCEFEDFYLETLKAKCHCNVKEKVASETNKIKFSPNKIVENFYKIEKYANIKVVTCYHQVFNIIKLKQNYGSYIIISIALIFIILMIINFVTINNNINKIIELLVFQSNVMIKIINKKEKEMKKEIDKKIKEKISNKELNKNNIKNKEKLTLNKHKVTSKNSKKSFNKEVKNINKKIHKNKISNPRKRNYKSKSIKIEKSNTISKTHLLNSNDEKFLNTHKRRNKLKSVTIKRTNQDLQSIINIKNNNNIIDKIILLIPKKERIKYFNEDELNNLEYQNALKIDFRTYCEFYFSLIKQTHLIVFTFFVKNDYNLFLLKYSLFVISFSLFLYMKALFFRDNSLHKIYEDEGKYDILYQLPQIMYSTIASQVISFLLEKLSLS